MPVFLASALGGHRRQNAFVACFFSAWSSRKKHSRTFPLKSKTAPSELRNSQGCGEDEEAEEEDDEEAEEEAEEDEEEDEDEKLMVKRSTGRGKKEKKKY